MSTNTDAERDDNARQLEAQLSGLARLGALIQHQYATGHPDRLAERIEQREQIERENILSVEVERTIRVVLCTGGPHCEVRWTEGHNPVAVCYGWFGAGNVERSLTDDEQTGLDAVIGGDFDEALYLIGDAG